MRSTRLRGFFEPAGSARALAILPFRWFLQYARDKSPQSCSTTLDVQASICCGNAANAILASVVRCAPRLQHDDDAVILLTS